jgi:hypothetical protein
MEVLRNIVNILALIGVPSLCTCAVFFVKACIKFSNKIDVLMNAVQKQMRRELTIDYHRYMENGCIDDDDLDMWEASYQAYHSLGVNGIMDSRREDLIKLNSRTEKCSLH